VGRIIGKKDWVKRLILNLIAQHPNGLSFWELAKITNLQVEIIKYNLKKLAKDGYVIKINRKYFIKREMFIRDGVISFKFNDSFLVFSCPHFKINCGCKPKDIKKCIYLKELPDILLKMFGKI
jgi:hypothetical protein